MWADDTWEGMGEGGESVLVDAILTATITTVLAANCRSESMVATITDTLSVGINNETLTADITDRLGVEIK